MSTKSCEVSIHMIDPADGRSLQKWSFDGQQIDCISIGRDEAAKIQLADPYVSRIHAELIRDEEGWTLFARGRNGVYVNGRSVTEARLIHGSRFRLASVGPTFRFDGHAVSTGQQTLVIDAAVMSLLILNKSEVAEQVNEIVESDYFKQLQEKARTLRSQRPKS